MSMNLNRKENRKTERLLLDKPLRVVMCSIGANIKYELLTKNISMNGFFLDFSKPGRFPFNTSSILEVWLELEENKTIFFNGKVARIVYPQDVQSGEGGSGIAIRIIQIDSNNEALLKEFIDKHINKQKNIS